MKSVIWLFLFFVSAKAQQFTKVTVGPFVNSPADSRTISWIDMNKDGFLDCYVTNGPSGGQNNFLYINDGAGGFAAFSGDTIVKDGMPSDGATWCDSDNDGDNDCYVANWYNTNNLFYTNNGDGTFTAQNGTIILSGGYCEVAAWGDYDNDGLNDLFVTNSAGTNKNLLFHNDGSNMFTKVTTGSIVNDINDSRACNWSDIDNDGDLDVFVCNESNQNEVIYENLGSGSFNKISLGALVNNGGKTMSSSWGDYDNDGDMDVFLANDQSPNALFRNDGGFSFTKIITDTVSKTPGHSFGSSWSDIDNDGDIDLYVTNSFFSTSLYENYLYMNNGDGTFQRTNSGTIASHLDWSYGCAFGDYDNDGFQDLAVATCRFNGSDRNNLLYHNDGNSNNHLTISLVGTQTNRSAIGTKVRVRAVINGVPTWQMREVSSQTGQCGQNDMRVHFGLGTSTQVDSLKIEWLSGNSQLFTNIPANQFITITEGQVVAGIHENEAISTLKVYPNPSKNKINIIHSLSFQKGDKIVIADSRGHEISVLSVAKKTKQIELELDHYQENSESIYFISLVPISGNSKTTLKVLKLK
ncbi:MAG: VCBS repeat-containing protein [Bacteroidia bacterium]|nr:VCBS repeat-containing protein [Bacteroidia bacterium]